MVQFGTGSLLLTGNNTFSGGMTLGVNSGTVQVGNTNALGSGAITDYGTLDLNGFSPTIAGLSANGTVTNTVTGTATLTLNGNSSIDAYFNGQMSDGGGGKIVALSLAGSLTETWYGVGNYSGGTTISNGGTLQIGAGAAGSISGNVLVNAGSTLEFSRTDSTTFGGVISGAGTVQQAGSGITVLTAANNYTGATLVSSGTLALGATTRSPTPAPSPYPAVRRSTLARSATPLARSLVPAASSSPAAH